ncbi:MAG TPA: AbrB/MazE/SpoVT family DNA-binding domain-containing protein [Candidatus Dormibacteraeota bacterium]|jgi:AbrB family looped-hinge helix DNA binding protein
MAERFDVQLGPQGRIVIPARLRRALGLKPGDRMVAGLEDQRVVLERREAVLARLQASFADAVPAGVSLVDELIEERRAEAARETTS